MSNFDAHITDLVTLANYSMYRTQAIPLTELMTDVFLAIKEETWDIDDDAVILKHITVVSTTDGQITDNGATSHLATYNFLFTTDETALLREFFTYYYGIKVKINGLYQFVEVGDLVPLQGLVAEE